MRKFGKLASVAMLVLAAISIVGLVGCNQVTSYETNELNLDKPAKSAVSTLTSFKLLKADNCAAKADGSYYNPNTDKTIDYLKSDIVGIFDGNTIWLDFATAGVTTISSYKPTIVIADKATISPRIDAVQYFGEDITYTVTAEDGTTKTEYVVRDYANYTKVLSEADLKKMIYIDGVSFTDVEKILETSSNANYNPRYLNLASGASKALTVKYPSASDNYPYVVKFSVDRTGGFDKNIYLNLDNDKVTARASTTNWGNLYGYTRAQLTGEIQNVTAKVYYVDKSSANAKTISTGVKLDIPFFAYSGTIKAPTINLSLVDINDTAVDTTKNPDEQRVVDLKYADGGLQRVGYDATVVWPDERTTTLTPIMLTYSSSDITVATVENGKVTAVNTGTATITAKCTVNTYYYGFAEKEATCKVTFN